MKQTIFEKIIARELPADFVYEDDKVVAFLDIKPVNAGHTLVITRIPYESYKDVPENELSHLMIISQKIGNAVMNATGAQGYNLITNCGEDAGQVVPHVHIHIIPRFKNDGHAHWQGSTIPSPEEQMATAKSIAQEL